MTSNFPHFCLFICSSGISVEPPGLTISQVLGSQSSVQGDSPTKTSQPALVITSDAHKFTAASRDIFNYHRLFSQPLPLTYCLCTSRGKVASLLNLPLETTPLSRPSPICSSRHIYPSLLSPNRLEFVVTQVITSLHFSKVTSIDITHSPHLPEQWLQDQVSSRAAFPACRKVPMPM